MFTLVGAAIGYQQAGKTIYSSASINSAFQLDDLFIIPFFIKHKS
ncbi:hypothetical protein AALB_3041 [Agarivorans albus MKT 106]|uniref:Uncharacterized protein n=1 Tax=Agarivorans albus MKT 106 TaxID=1331007 RepID=R9PTT1_AGAAL|nr:hypothetical protein AALB_3041 [Agarivorans albus MKT 106]